MFKDLQPGYHCKKFEGKKMKHKKISAHYLSILIIASLFLSACYEYEKPPEINTPTLDYSGNPLINHIEPGDSAVAGVREISIVGQNFAVDGNDTNWVFIGGEPALIKSISSERIVVHRPPIFGDNIDINVIIPTALATAKVSNYKIEEPVVQYGDFQYEAYDLMDIEVDEQENLYIATRRKLIKLASNGIDITEVGSYGSDFAKITDLKFGPEGYLYVLVGDNEIFRIDISTGIEEEYFVIPENTDVFDFDETGNIYAGRRDGIFVINPDKNVTSTGRYDGIPIIEVRVFDNYLYVSSASALYRNQILDNTGSLGDDQLVVDLDQTSEFQSTDISSFNIDENGSIYFCLKSHPKYSIFILENDGSLSPYYKANILPLRVDNIIWGNDRYVYLNRGTQPRDSVRLYRMGMDKAGAPNIGRNF